MVTRFAAKGLFLAFVLASLTSVRAAACTTAIVSAEASSTGRPMIWKQRDADNVRNGLAYMRGERFSYTGIYAGIGLVMLGCVGLTGRLLPWTGWAGLAVQVAVGMLVYGLLCLPVWKKQGLLRKGILPGRGRKK